MKMKKILAAMAATVVSATAASAMTFTASAADVLGNAYFIGAIGTENCWKITDVTADSTIAAVDGNAQYEASWVLAGDGTDTIQFLTLLIEPAEGVDNFGISTFPNLDVAIDELWIDGAKVEDYSMSAGAVNTNYFEGGAGVTRIYLHDQWAGTGTADIPSATTITESVRVKFTVSGLDVDGTSNIKEDPTEAPTDAPTEAATTTTTAAGGDTTTAAGGDTTTAADGATTTSKDSTTAKGGTTTAKGATTTAKPASNASTGVTGVGVAVATLTVAGAVALVSRKKN